MTTADNSIRRPLREWLDDGRLRLGPAEGWLTLIMAAVLAATFAWSLDDAGWVPRTEGSTQYLIWVAAAGVVAGFVGAKVGWGRWTTHLVGALVAGLAIPIIVGGIVLGPAAPGLDPVGLAVRVHASGDLVRQVWIDLVVQGRALTSQYGHYHMVFAAMVWAAGQLTGYAVFGRRRPIDGVIVTGILLLSNMAITRNDQLQDLVLFSVAALVLVVRAHAFDEQIVWIRRRIGDPHAVAGLYLRGGAGFVGAAVIGALFLTATASSSPLQSVWADMPQRLAQVTQWLERYAPNGGNPRGLGTIGFGPNATINGLWEPLDKVAFVAQLPANDTRLFKWRAGVYSIYTLDGWQWGDTASVSRSAHAPVLGGTADDPSRESGRRELQIRVTPVGFFDSTILSPDSVELVDRATTVHLNGGRFTTVESDGGSGPYAVSALVPVEDSSVPGALTQWRLRLAGKVYPADIVRDYLQVPDGSMGPNADALLQRIKSLAAGQPGPAGNAYDLAQAMQDYLRDPANFTYATDVREAARRECSGLSTVECFATIRTGYCEYYATEMAVLLRAAGVPTRVAYGFLPGDRTPAGSETVNAASAHWWVEVYFPVYGWVEFDPTGHVGVPLVLPSGVPETPRPTSFGSALPNDTGRDVLGNRGTSGGGTTETPGGGGPGPFVAIALILALGVVAVALAARRRSPRPMHPDRAWGSLGALAARFGLGPRPAQTVYEYAGMLGDAVPDIRPELTTVARAKVEVAYGNRELGADRMRLVAQAYGRLRLAIVRVALRPDRWRRRRR